jgi:hypothetical protein
MTRLARMVAPGLPHPVTQRGNRREAIFFEDGYQPIYCDLLAEQLRKSSVEVWAYCVMPNLAHLILTPQGADGMPGPRGSAPPPHELHQCAWPMDGYADAPESSSEDNLTAGNARTCGSLCNAVSLGRDNLLHFCAFRCRVTGVISVVADRQWSPSFLSTKWSFA